MPSSERHAIGPREGNRVLRSFLRRGTTAFLVNPGASEVEGLTCYLDLASLPRPPHAICITTPPQVSESIIEQAGRLGVKNVWMQPGAESGRAIDRARQLGMNVVAGGPCVLTALAHRESPSADTEAPTYSCSLRVPGRDGQQGTRLAPILCPARAGEA